MSVKFYKPTTPGRRGMTTLGNEELTTNKPEKSLLISKKRISGRNNHGHITVRHRGGGAKRKIRIVDFNRTDKLDIPAKVTTIEYDPNRSANISLLVYNDGEKRYILAPRKLKVGFSLICSEKTSVQPGNRMCVGNIPTGIEVHDVEINLNRGGQVGKSAGIACIIMSQDGDKTLLKMPSGRTRYLDKKCYATIGIVGNEDHSNIVIGKAGRKRHMGWRPAVRGKVMNPNDHPHGGGEGRNSIGMKYPKTPWGKHALGVKTRRRKYSNYQLADIKK